jgi:U3 small nucleolar RNA-associated protein MPP10
MANKEDFHNECLETFQQITKKPTYFLQTDEEFSSQLKDTLKKIYDFTKKQEINMVTLNALPELIVQNFDLEQIWQQIELQNDSLITRSLIATSKLVVGKNNLLFKNLEKEVANVEEENNTEEELEVEDDEPSSEDHNSIKFESDEEFVPTNEPTREMRPSVVDDEFFKLDEMEKFLQVEEKKLNDPDSGNDSESGSESEDSVDLFEGAAAAVDDDDDNSDCLESAKYDDFFGTKQEGNGKNVGKKCFDDEEDDEEEQPRSSFELRQDRLNKKIEDIEEQAVQEKSWQLKGEISADSRPQNSLLEEVVEFDLTTRPAPVITEQTTMQLEDIIKQRIRDKVFDSVERKAKPVETLLEYKKKLVLEQEKSKESLAQIYEREYIEQKSALDPEFNEEEKKEPELHTEIDSMMKSLFAKLDALSNFHFTPKAAIPDLQIVSNLPAISMEEVAPVATSDATLLAPEEVKTKTKGDEIGKMERSATDKKRERRKKKLKQKMHAIEKNKKEQTKNTYDKKKVLERLTKEKNIDKMDESASRQNVKSSKAFFTQLEEEVKSQVKRKTADKPHKKGDAHSAKKLKL